MICVETFVVCVRDFPRVKFSVKVGVMEYRFKHIISWLDIEKILKIIFKLTRKFFSWKSWCYFFVTDRCTLCPKKTLLCALFTYNFGILTDFYNL